MRDRSRIVKGKYLTNRDRSGILSTMAKKKNPHAVALGRKGGLKGGPARAAKLTPEERRASAKKAAQARWKDQRPN
jgi:hypothetical protein